ncbi:FtsW/RodA/SpoVE family cell cycle protein [Paracrocinitomix mangrovi]|uniref:FtsW/RodA/SpoVE family cell cycle protein n=1 Tax=Paracrocinitomix mangrovi TaxID=2862509 RepID=UPI001C8D6C2D|nr:FtsW/RodA/SpoVE family cell cycle protein [Paracrocinitomix mangrovi]UKN03348.1 FtsW/RodA/SpoVE family cell cycle protein [Paracrocinitomix mangrovi]
MKNLFKYLGGDKNIWVLSIVLGILSVVSVFSFIPILVKTKEMSYSYLFFKHLILLGLGFVIMYIVHKIPVRVFSKLSKILFYISIVLLVLTMFMGESVNGADRWLKIPFLPFSFQTSDFAKLALVIYLARQLVKREKDFNDFNTVFKYILLPTGLTMFLILPSNLSTAVLIGLLAFVMMIMAKFPFKWIFLSMGGVTLIFSLLLLVSSAYPEALPRVDTWRSRIVNAFADEGEVDPNKNMQVNNALAAIKNGAVPKGPGNGVLKQYIPEAYADFYFAALIEEGGLLMAVVVIMLYMWLFYRIIKTSIGAKSEFATYLAVGIGVMMMSQVMVNMMVSTKLMPVTGQNMPLLSMGGTSAWFTCIAFGIVLSISREQMKEKKSDKPDNELNTITETQNAIA